MSKISALSELAEAPASTDEFVIVDKSDTTQSASGTTKRIQSQYVTIADASTTVKGKVELATDAETITGTDAVRAVTPANITAKIDTDGTLAGNLDTRIPSQKAVKTYGDSGVQTMTNKTLTAPIITTPTIKTYNGWQLVSDTWTYASADSPTFTITVPSGAASLYGVGWRIKLTQTTEKYFIITAVADTVLTVYGGTDYTLANAAISSVYVSPMKAPLGFPLDPLKWQVNATDSTERTQVPVANTWYNLGSLSLSVPIGCWEISYDSDVYISEPAGGSVQVSLSTSSSSESDGDITCQSYVSAADGLSVHMSKRKHISLASKTSYYLIEKTVQVSVDSIKINLSAGGETTTSIIRAICAYL